MSFILGNNKPRKKCIISQHQKVVRDKLNIQYNWWPGLIIDIHRKMRGLHGSKLINNLPRSYIVAIL